MKDSQSIVAAGGLGKEARAVNMRRLGIKVTMGCIATSSLPSSYCPPPHRRRLPAAPRPRAEPRHRAVGAGAGRPGDAIWPLASIRLSCLPRPLLTAHLVFSLHSPPHIAQADRNLDGADCVLWYTLGLTHVVRTEVRTAG